MASEGQNPEQNNEGMSPEQAREILLRLLQSQLFVIEDETEAREIVDSLTDWIDTDDDESDYGAESSYYDSLEYPLVPRNGPVEFPEELLQVKGISKDLLYGNGDKEPLLEYINVENKSGKININTAPIALIQALDERISEEDVEGVDQYRRDENNTDALGDSSWLTDYLPGDIGDEDLNSILTTESSHFLVESHARELDYSKTMKATIERISENEMRRISLRLD
jgi:general secretion pathway protein K